MPSGWPSAIAPPFGFTCSASSAARARAAPPGPARRTPRSARSRRSRRASGRAAASSFCVAGAGPMPMMRGATPAVAIATTRARGVRPCRCGRRLARRGSARAAPSLTPEALPAVTVPSGLRNGALQLRQRLERGVARGCSSCDRRRRRPCFRAIVDRHDLARRRSRSPAPPRRAAGCAARTRPGRRASIWKSSATFSAVSGIESTPYCSFISGLTKRQPMVVS